MQEKAEQEEHEEVLRNLKNKQDAKNVARKMKIPQVNSATSQIEALRAN